MSTALRHLTKNRVAAPQKRRLPSKFAKPRSELDRMDDSGPTSLSAQAKSVSDLSGSGKELKRDILRLNERPVRV